MESRKETNIVQCLKTMHTCYIYVASNGKAWFHVEKMLWGDGGGVGVGQDHVQQLLLTLHSFHHGVFHREKNMLATNAFVF